MKPFDMPRHDVMTVADNLMIQRTRHPKLGTFYTLMRIDRISDDVRHISTCGQFKTFEEAEDRADELIDIKNV